MGKSGNKGNCNTADLYQQAAEKLLKIRDYGLNWYNPSVTKKNFYFQAKSPLSIIIHTTKTYWDYICKMKHPEVTGKLKRARQTIEDPVIIKQSFQDLNTYLYYRKTEDKYFCIVAKHENGEGFILTAYITYKFVKGELIWQKLKK